MQTEPRLPELALRTPEPERDPVGSVLERLTGTGYQIDRQKWERFVEADLVGPLIPTSRGEREAIKRLRRLLDVERRLAPTGDVDALCFHLAASGVECVPVVAVARHVEKSVRELLAIGGRLSAAEAADAHSVDGPDGERRASEVLARRCLTGYRPRDRAEYDAACSVLSAAFVAYLRSVGRSRRPVTLLHASSRLVSLDEVAERAPRVRHDEPLPPLAPADVVCAWLQANAMTSDVDLLKAVKSVAALLRLHVRRYPELQVAWRDIAAEYGSEASVALAALAAAAPVFVAALLQAGRLPDAANIEQTLEQLMHHWGATLRL